MAHALLLIWEIIYEEPQRKKAIAAAAAGAAGRPCCPPLQMSIGIYLVLPPLTTWRSSIINFSTPLPSLSAAFYETISGNIYLLYLTFSGIMWHFTPPLAARHRRRIFLWYCGRGSMGRGMAIFKHPFVLVGASFCGGQSECKRHFLTCNRVEGLYPMR